MQAIARRPIKDRTDLFRSAGQKMGIHEAIIEKDFWVCWVLDDLFRYSPWKDTIAFKGGTSLSKAYSLIERFSEDIDIILDWKVLGYTDKDPWMQRSITQQARFGEEANRKTALFLQERMAPYLKKRFGDLLDTSVEMEAEEQMILFSYPRAFSLNAILPRIQLEIGPIAAWIPNEEREIRPYAAEQFPNLFRNPTAFVRTITAERTFWEKATILHQEAHRSGNKSLPLRYSRHYYDLFRLSTSPLRKRALNNLGLLDEVRDFKIRFYHCSWARYEKAVPESIRLVPDEYRMDELRRDYRSMRSMLYGTVASFEEIIDEIQKLEEEIHSLRKENAEAPF